MIFDFEPSELKSRSIKATYTVDLEQSEPKKYCKIWWKKIVSKKGPRRVRWIKVHRLSIEYMLAARMAKQISDEMDKDLLSMLLGETKKAS